MAARIYKLQDGTRVPSVTTVNKIGQETGGLVHWAWKLGTEGKDYRSERDAAADAGTVGHALVEAAIKNMDAPDLSGFPEDVRASGEMAFSAYRQWRSMTNLEILHAEVSLVSEKHRYGGTLDAMIRSGGKLALGDWKTGRVYPDHLFQVAAYGLLWNETHPDDPITGGYHLLRFSKETGDFSHSHFADLSAELEGFLLKLRLYPILIAAKKRV